MAVSRSGTGIGGVEREAMGWQLAGRELVSVALAAMQELQAQKSRLAAAWLAIHIEVLDGYL